MSSGLFCPYLSGDNVRGGKYIVVVVVSETGPVKRHWIITAYIARKLVGGETEWKRS